MGALVSLRAGFTNNLKLLSIDICSTIYLVNRDSYTKAFNVVTECRFSGIHFSGK